MMFRKIPSVLVFVVLAQEDSMESQTNGMTRVIPWKQAFINNPADMMLDSSVVTLTTISMMTKLRSLNPVMLQMRETCQIYSL
ncbi:hypothetical protein V1515DRAFT_599996 [Lipomyces mesembrius]